MNMNGVLGGILCVVLLGQGATAENCSNTNPCPFKGRDAKLPMLREYISSAGKLSLNLTVQITKMQFEWFQFWRRTYDGHFPAPTWRVKQGDVVTVFLENTLGPNQPAGKMNEQRHPNGTNIHTHGLHISSKAPGDNVFTVVDPGNNYTYNFEIDAQNPPGTYWYHPHLHGSTFLQVQSGMAGMIVVEDPVDASTPQHIQDISCPNNCQHDVQLMFQPSLMYWSPDGKGFAKIQKEIKDDPYFRTDRFIVTKTGQKLSSWLATKNVGPYHMTVNGKLWPTYDMTTGQQKRFRMVNAGGNVVLEMTITGPNATPLSGGCQFLEIAVDGVYLDKAVSPRMGKSYMVPAARIDWLVVCDKPGMYEVRSLNAPLTPTDSLGNAERFNDTLFHLNVTGLATTTTLMTTVPQRPSFVKDFRNYTQDQVHGRHVIEVNPKSTLNRLKFLGEGHPRFTLEVNTVQEWYITNTNLNSYHPIHIHINHFQVISYNKYTGPFAQHKNSKLTLYAQDGSRCHYQPPGWSPRDNVASYRNANLGWLGHENLWLNEALPGTMAYSRPGVFRDTIHVPPMSNITIRFMAHKYTGKGVVHCHILKHEDKGMMYTFDIVDKLNSTTPTHTKAGNGYPSQCKPCDPFPFNQVVTNCPGGPTNAPPPVGAGGSGPGQPDTSGASGNPSVASTSGTSTSAGGDQNAVGGKSGTVSKSTNAPVTADPNKGTSTTGGVEKTSVNKWSFVVATVTALIAGLFA